MAVPNWGSLQKSQVDNETIEEAIARIVAEHEADEAAHLGAGESLQSHKASEIIDHAAESIINDKIADGSVTGDKITAEQIIAKDLRTATDVGSTVDGVKFNSSGIEMWQSGVRKVRIPVSGEPSFSGTVSIGNLSYNRPTFHVPLINNSTYELVETGTDSGFLFYGTTLSQYTPSDVGGVCSFSLKEDAFLEIYNTRNPALYFEARFRDTEYQDTYIVMGALVPTTTTERFVGFKINHNNPNKIYCVYRNSGVSESVYEISGVDPEVFHRYKVEFISSGAYVVWTVDGTIVRAQAFSFSGFYREMPFVIYSKGVSAGNNCENHFFNILWQQDSLF